jgi:hypothetical protein
MNAPALLSRVTALIWIGVHGLYLRGTICSYEIPLCDSTAKPNCEPRILDFTPMM